MFQALRRIHVAASDFPRSRRFYGETLGLPEAGGFESDWVEFALGPILLKLTPLRSGEVPARNQVAAIFSTRELEPTLTTLKERGVTVTRGPFDEFTGRAAEILDPDGYRIIVFEASDLHPDEEWVPMSRVDERVRQKMAKKRQKEKGRPGKSKISAKRKKKGSGKSSAKKSKSASKGKKKAAGRARRSSHLPSKKKTAKRPAKKSARRR
jgi:predicted enzyme related to lactoylglutathione lyase